MFPDMKNLEKKGFLFLFVISLALFISSCCKDQCQDKCNPKCSNYCDDRTNPACCNYDSCIGKVLSPPRIIAATKINDRYFEQDTFTSTQEFHFRCLDERTSYSWRLSGSAQRWTTRNFFLYFNNQPRNIEAQLVTTRPLAGACFPNDNGRDTSTTRFSIIPSTRLEESPWPFGLNGRWRGTCTCFPNQAYEISLVDTFIRSVSPNSYRKFMYNLFPNAMPIMLRQAGHIAAEGARWDQPNSDAEYTRSFVPGTLYFYSTPQNRDTVTLEFTRYVGNQNVTQPCIFKGVKAN